MDKETQQTQLLLDRIDSVGEHLGEKIAEVKTDLKEVRDAYMRKSECLQLIANEREQRGETVKRIWDKLEDGPNNFEARISAIERARLKTSGAEEVKTGQWKIVVAVITAVLAGFLVQLLRTHV